MEYVVFEDLYRYREFVDGAMEIWLYLYSLYYDRQKAWMYGGAWNVLRFMTLFIFLWSN